jgi:hypothetical protein
MDPAVADLTAGLDRHDARGGIFGPAGGQMEPAPTAKSASIRAISSPALIVQCGGG